MSRSGFTLVMHVFADETADAFGFLVTEFGLTGPERSEVVQPAIAFAGDGVRYRIILATDDKALLTEVEVDLTASWLVADLGSLVRATGLGSPSEVVDSARTHVALRKSLASQSGYVRRLHPLLRSTDPVELLRAANAREWHRG